MFGRAPGVGPCRFGLNQRRTVVVVVVLGIACALGLAASAGVAGAADNVESDTTPAEEQPPEFVVDVDGPESAQPGETVTVTLTVEPGDGLEGNGSEREQKIDWFELQVDTENLEYEGLEEAAFGSVEVEQRDDEVFLDSDEELRAADAPVTLATLEYTVSNESGAEAVVDVDAESQIGWGPDWLRAVPLFQHEAAFGSESVTVEDHQSEQARFDATNTGGYIALGEETTPPEDTVAFPEESVEIQATVDNGTWESTSVELPTLSVENQTDVELSLPSGLSGEIDRSADRVTANGPLELELVEFNTSVEYDLRLTTGESGELEGSANLSASGGTATLVDNEFTYGDTCIPELPGCLPGGNFLELPLTIDFDDGESDPSVDSFAATSTEGLIAIDEETEDDARANGVSFGPGEFRIEGEVTDDRWESTNVEIAQRDIAGLSTDVEAAGGLAGAFDPSTGTFTAEGELTFNVSEEQFGFELAATTGQSGALDGAANLTASGGTATLVDNEFAIGESGSFLIDVVLGLPADPGTNWFEVALDVDTET